MNVNATTRKLNKDAGAIALRMVRACVRSLGGSKWIGPLEDTTLIGIRMVLEAIIRTRLKIEEAQSVREIATLDRALAQLARQLTKLLGMLPAPRGKRALTVDDIIRKAQRRRPTKRRAEPTDPGADAPTDNESEAEQ